MNKIQLKYGNVSQKQIKTPNDFVSHMIEHIAWRMGLSINLVWQNEDWQKLGEVLGEEIKAISDFKQNEAIYLGSIDDGTAKVKIAQTELAKVQISATKNVDLDFFLNTRCEQISNSKPLEELLNGLAKALNLDLEIVILNHKDSHHTWEGVFRSIGVCLQTMLAPVQPEIDLKAINQVEKNVSKSDISVLKRSLLSAEVRRGTAESGVEVRVDFTGDPQTSNFNFQVNDSIKTPIKNLNKLFLLLAKNLGANLQINFTAKALSSSHVVLEDIGLVLGRALLEILKLRFKKTGANGAGCSFQKISDFTEQNAALTVSVEGRKFWDFIPADGNFPKLQQEFLIGKNVFDTIYSEDLDDFFDGLSGGLSASIIVHINQVENTSELWQQVFINLGVALREVFIINAQRQGLPPGVKATLS